jgi:hypothetical protein
VPVTGLVVLDSRIVPPLRPTKPPTMLFGPVLVGRQLRRLVDENSAGEA